MSAARMYIIQAVNERTGRRTDLPMRPVPHHEACTMLKRFSPHPARRLLLKQVSAS